MHVGDLLSALIDGQLDADQRELVERHLDECPDCGTELRSTTAARREVRGLPMLEVPPGTFDLAADVVPIRKRRRRPLVAAAAVATLVVGIGFGVNGNNTVPE